MKKTKIFAIHFAGHAAVEAESEEKAMEAFGKLEVADYDDFQITEVEEDNLKYQL
jgi:hypothetical protein